MYSANRQLQKVILAVLPILMLTAGGSIVYLAKHQAKPVLADTPICTAPVDPPSTYPLNGATSTDLQPQLYATAQINPYDIIWYSTDWEFRKSIVIDHTKVGNGLTDFPVLISLTSDTDLADNAQASGDDILFTDINQNKLSYEIVSYQSGTLEAWVKLDQLPTSTDTEIYMYYGNPSASNQEDVNGVWQSSYESVHHMSETSGNITDSTSHGRTGNDNGTTSIAGKVGNARDFDGVADDINFGTYAGMDWSQSYTISMWMNIDVFGDARSNCATKRSGIFDKSSNSLQYISSDTYNSAGSNIFAHIHRNSAGTASYYVGTTAITAGSWQYVTVVYNKDAALLSLYRNGAFVTSMSTGSDTLYNPSAANALLGNFEAGCSYGFLDGKLDEYMVSSTARTQDWITTAYNDQNSPGTFYTVGSPTQYQSAGTFNVNVNYYSSFDPRGVVIGDINSDGYNDMITANRNSNNIYIFSNNGNGTYADPAIYTTGGGPYDVSVGNLDSDGNKDLVTANYSSGTVSVLLNNGDGTFADKVDYAAGVNPVSVKAADVNGDTVLDIITANNNDGKVFVLLNNGDGTFASAVSYTTLAQPQEVAVVDLNSDNFPEIIVAESNPSKVSVLTNNGDGTFINKVDYTTGTTPYSVDVGDINGDTHPDLVTANFSSNTVSVFMNNGSGGFGAKVDYATANTPYHVVLADLNDDDTLDIATANNNSNMLSILFNNGDGTFATKTDYSFGGNIGYKITAGFVNNDDKIDLVVAARTNNQVMVLINQLTINLDTTCADNTFSDFDVQEIGTVYDLPIDTLGTSTYQPSLPGYDTYYWRARTLNLAAPDVFSSTQLPNADYVGSGISTAIGDDGNPIIAYFNITDLDMEVMKCNDPLCTGNDETITQFYDTDDVGYVTSVAIGADGNPFILYINNTDTDIMALKCNDPACTGGDETLSQITGYGPPVTLFPSIKIGLAIGTDGNPVFSGMSDANKDLVIVKCNDPACAGNNETISIIPNPDDVGYWVELALGDDGNPALSYYNITDTDLMFTKCNDPACSGNDESTTQFDDPPYNTGAYNSIAIGWDGNPVITHLNATPLNGLSTSLMVTKCNDPACTGSDETTTQIQDADYLGLYTAVAIDARGNPVIAHYSSSDKDLIITKCNDPGCTGNDEATTQMVNPDIAGSYGDVAVNNDGVAIIPHFNATDGDIIVTTVDPPIGPWSNYNALNVIGIPSNLTVDATTGTTANVSWTPGQASNYIEVLPDNLLAHWRLDESSSTRYDSYNTHDLAENLSPTGSTTGVIGNAAGSGFPDGGLINNDNELKNTSQHFSVAMWFKAATVGNSREILVSTFPSVSGGGWMIYTANNNVLRFLMRDTPTHQYYTDFQGFTTDQWHFLVVVRDNSVVTMYLDGVAQSAGGWPAIYPTTGPFMVGDTPAYANYEFSGAIDSLYMWDKSLSAAEAATLYDSELNPSPSYTETLQYRKVGDTWSSLITPNQLPDGQAGTHQFLGLEINQQYEWRVNANYLCCDMQTVNGPNFITYGLTDYNITKTLLSADPSHVGEVVNFLITLNNTGDNTLTTADIQDTFDPDVFTYWSSTSPTPTLIDNANGVLTWYRLGPIPGGTQYNITVSLVAKSSTEPDTTINGAQMTGGVDEWAQEVVASDVVEAEVQINEGYPWFSVIDSDIFSNGDLSLEVPPGHWAITGSDSLSGGLGMAYGNVNYSPGNLSDRGWEVKNYQSNMAFPSFDYTAMINNAENIPAGWDPEADPINFENGKVYYYGAGDITFPKGYTIFDSDLSSGESATLLVNGNINILGDFVYETNAFDRSLTLITVNGGDINISNESTRVDGLLVADGDINTAFEFVANADDGLVYSSYFGGSGTDTPQGIIYDDNDNMYVAGYTSSLDLPGASGGDAANSDIFVSKFDPNGKLIWTNVFGGSSVDEAYDIAISDDNSYVVIAGETTSSDFPIVGASPFDNSFAALTDGFIAKLDTAEGDLVWSTYLGGSWIDMIKKVIIDASDNIIYCGNNFRDEFPTTSGAYDETHNGTGYDIVAGKLSSDGSNLIWGTYLGGATSGDLCTGLNSDSDGKIYIGGYTSSTDYPITPGSFSSDIGEPTHGPLLSILSSDGSSLIYSTTFGMTTGNGSVYGVTLDPNDNDVYLAGFTDSPSTAFPITPYVYDTSYNGVNDGFVARMDPEGNGTADLLWATYLGGSDADIINDIDVDISGNVSVVGATASTTATGFPVTTNAFQAENAGGYDSFLAQFQGDTGQLLYSTFFGGSLNDSSDPRVAYNQTRGQIYFSARTTSTDFPLAGNPYQLNNAGNGDGLVMRWAIGGYHLVVNGNTLAHGNVDFGSRQSPSPLDLAAETYKANLYAFVNPPPGISKKETIWKESSQQTNMI